MDGWKTVDPFLLGWPIFRCKLAVSFREGSFWLKLAASKQRPMKIGKHIPKGKEQFFQSHPFSGAMLRLFDGM